MVFVVLLTRAILGVIANTMFQIPFQKFLFTPLSIFFAVLGMPSSIAQEDPIPIYAVASDGSTKLEKNDFFYDALHLFLPTDGFTYQLHEVIHIRSAHLFFANKQSCRFPANLKVFNQGFKRPVPNQFIESEAFLINNIRVLSASNERPPKNAEDMRGKSLAIPIGSKFHTKLDISDTNVIQTVSDLKRLEMLSAGRIDLIMLSMPSAIRLFSTTINKPPVYDTELSLLEFTHHLSCHRTERNTAFIEAVNTNIIEAKQSGELRALFIKYGFEEKTYYPKS